jgi:predicted nucleotidyltransferase
VRTERTAIDDICGVGTLKEILEILRTERAQLFTKHGLKSMAIFGSMTRDDHGPHSDVDIMVEFVPGADYDFLELAEELERLVHRRVDLVVRKAVKPWYMKYIEPQLLHV